MMRQVAQRKRAGRRWRGGEAGQARRWLGVEQCPSRRRGRRSQSWAAPERVQAMATGSAGERRPRPRLRATPPRRAQQLSVAQGWRLATVPQRSPTACVWASSGVHPAPGTKTACGKSQVLARARACNSSYVRVAPWQGGAAATATRTREALLRCSEVRRRPARSSGEAPRPKLAQRLGRRHWATPCAAAALHAAQMSPAPGSRAAGPRQHRHGTKAQHATATHLASARPAHACSCSRRHGARALQHHARRSACAQPRGCGARRADGRRCPRRHTAWRRPAQRRSRRDGSRFRA